MLGGGRKVVTGSASEIIVSVKDPVVPSALCTVFPAAQTPFF